MVTTMSERVRIDRQESHVAVHYQHDIPQTHGLREMVEAASVAVLIMFKNELIYRVRLNRQMVFTIKFRDMLTNGKA